MTEKPLPPTTTVEEDLHSAGQRRVNLIWETTQSLVAILVTVATIAGVLQLNGIMRSDTLTNAFFLIIGFYFGRTNHERVGGVVLRR